MAGLYEGQESPRSSTQVWPAYPRLSVEDITRSQERRLPELQDIPTGSLLENLTLEDISHDPIDDITHRLLDRWTHPSLADYSAMTERGQQNPVATLPVVRPSQAAGNDRRGPVQPAVGRMMRSHVGSMEVSYDSSWPVHRAITTQVQRGLGSVAGQSHVFLGTQSHENLRPSQGPSLPSLPSWRTTLGPSLPRPPFCRTILGPSLPRPPSWRTTLGPSLPRPPSWRTTLGPSLPRPPFCRTILGPSLPNPVFYRTTLGPNLTNPPSWRPTLGSRLPDTPSWGGALEPRVPSRPSLVVPQQFGVSSWGVPQGPSLANWNSSTQILPTNSRDSTGFLLRDQIPHQEGSQGTETKIKLYTEFRSSLIDGSKVDIFPLKRSGLFKRGREPYVCENFLVGRCQMSSYCSFYHTLLPFHWQFHIKDKDLWYSIPLGTQMHLEMVNADPNFQIVPVLYDDKIQYLDMKQKQFVEKDRYFDFARRLCCEDSSFFSPPMNTYYLYGPSWILKNEETENLLTSGFEVILRPKYIPLYQNVKNLRVWFSDPSRNRAWWGEEPTDIYMGRYPCKRLAASMAAQDRFLVVEIAPSEPAYEYCCQLFHASVSPENILVLKIYRYYNPRVWKRYQKQKRRLKTLRLPGPLEHHLFYKGFMTLESLTSNGLCRVSRRTGGILGRGLYFSLNAYIAPTIESPQCGHVTVLAKVLIGEKTLGNPFLFAPPQKANGQEYDCCVNDVNMPTLFNIFDRDLTYPYFIIFYRRLIDQAQLD